MKNQLKLAFGITLMIVFSAGCEKYATKPVAMQKIDQAAKKFTVTSDTFKNGAVDYDLLRKNKINGPHLAWKNAPTGTKGFWIIMDNDQNHVYWKMNTAHNFTSLKEDRDPLSASKIILPEKYEGIAVIEIFALNCTPNEFENTVEKGMGGKRIHHVSRARFKEILKTNGLSNMILGSTKVEYIVNPQILG